ncbi:DUF1648 domain-containing protein [Leucobacter chinensis]|uniref:DUF1648 domain-containing protein n=1 Tax=Leucobacter chinensis TaxID=2851010 RepID=UPI001C2375BD|nr:DUF1648 domain-containing protein [Leucobacter chinensis]
MTKHPISPAHPAERPPRTYVTGPVTRCARYLTIAAAVAVVVVGIVGYVSMPDTIPTHYGVNGEPDQWGPRGSFIALLILAALVSAGMVIASYFPGSVNVPRVIPVEKAQAYYRRVEQLLIAVAAVTVILYAAIVFSAVYGVNVLLPLIGVVTALLATATVGTIGLVRALR